MVYLPSAYYLSRSNQRAYSVIIFATVYIIPIIWYNYKALLQNTVHTAAKFSPHATGNPYFVFRSIIPVVERKERHMRFRGALSSFWLKNIMLVLMVLDHLYQYLFPEKLLFAHYLARVVAPVFAFLMVQGMIHTRNRRRYILRLLIAGIIMAAGNFILLTATGIYVPNNIFLSLAAGAALIFCIDKICAGKDVPVWLVCGAAVVMASFYCEGQYIVPLMAVIFYYLRERRSVMYAAFVILCGAPFVVSYALAGTLEPQFWMICSVFPIMLYNGSRGPDGKTAKYFFYAFYPAHVWIIVLIKFFCF